MMRTAYVIATKTTAAHDVDLHHVLAVPRPGLAVTYSDDLLAAQTKFVRV